MALLVFFANFDDFDSSGKPLRGRIGENGMTTVDYVAAGYQPITLPSGRHYGDLLGVQRDGNGSIEFEWPDHIREWESFKDALIADPRSAEIIQTSLAAPALGVALSLFLSAIDSLMSRQTPEHLATFLNLWMAFQGAILSLTDSGALTPGIVDEIKAIAAGLNIVLPDPPAP